MKKNRLRQLTRKVEAERWAKIRAFKRPWLNLVRLAPSPCKGLLPEYGRCYQDKHATRSKRESRWVVARLALILGVIELLVFFAAAFAMSKPSHGPVTSLSPAFAWMLHFSWLFCVSWFATTVMYFQAESSDWSHHAYDLARARKQLQDVTLGTLLMTELKAQVAAAKQRLFEGDAGLTVWEGRVDARLKELPATEVVTVSPAESGHPYHAPAGLTVEQTATDQADLYDIAGRYSGLKFRIAETIVAYEKLAEILGQSIDRRDGLGRQKGTDFNPRKDMAQITKEVNERLDAMFTELDTLQAEVSKLNSRAESALSTSVVKSVTKSIVGVRISFDGSSEVAVVTAPSGDPAKERRNGK